MKPKDYARPELSEDKRQALIDVLAGLESAEGEDAAYWLECEWLKMEIRQLLTYQLKPGDGSLKAKATQVLEVGARHIAEGRPSELFLKFVAHSITRTLSGDENSLDHAFRLARPSRRPKKDPYGDPAIVAALKHLHMKHLEDDAANVCAETIRADAVDKAYAVKWKHTPQEAEAREVDKESLRKRKKQLDETLRQLGY